MLRGIRKWQAFHEEKSSNEKEKAKLSELDTVNLSYAMENKSRKIPYMVYSQGILDMSYFRNEMQLLLQTKHSLEAVWRGGWGRISVWFTCDCKPA